MALDAKNPTSDVPRVMAIVDSDTTQRDINKGSTGDGIDDKEFSTDTSSSSSHSSNSTINYPPNASNDSLDEEDDFSSALSDIDVLRIEWGMQQVRRILAAAPFRDLLVREVTPDGGDDESDWVSSYYRS